MPNEIGINFSQYKAGKAAGALSITKVANSKTRVLLMKQNFDSGNGQELDPIIVPLNARVLQDAKKMHQAEIDGIDAVLADMAALGIDTSPAPEIAA